MVHHRCSVCREEVGRRHKVHSFLACDDCLRRINYGDGPRRGLSFMSFFSMAWKFLRDLPRRLFKPASKKTTMKQVSSATLAKMRVNQTRMRTVTVNPAAVSPQKR